MTDIKNVVVEFDYTKEAIQKIVEEAKAIDTSNIEEVENATKALVKVRTTIKKQGKAYRDDANAFNKSVLAKEKEYLALSVGLEEKYKQLIEDHKEKQIMEARKELLPMKRQQLGLLDYSHDVTDEELLAMSDEQWVAYYQAEMQYSQEQLELAEQEEVRAQEQAEREEQIKKEAEERAEKEKAEALAKAEEDKKQAVEQAKREAEEKAQREKEEEKAKEEAIAKQQADLEKKKKYQKFLLDNGYDEKTDIIQNDGKEVRLYRIVNTFKL